MRQGSQFERIVVILFSLLCMATCGTAYANSVFKVIVTVDWEGYSLEPDNVLQMQIFRRQFPHIPFVQLLNPAYFVRAPQKASNIKETIQSTFLSNDVHGLHLHAWRSVVEHCGVAFKHSPSFAPDREQCGMQGDCGYTVSLEYAYSMRAIKKLLTCGQTLLQAQGFKKPNYFRAGGWQAGKKTRKALSQTGFTWDSSVVPPQLLTSRWLESSLLIRMLTKLHPTATTQDQPYHITPTLVEYPNNVALADYTNTDKLLQLFEQLLDSQRKVMVMGFHQETAALYLPRIAKAIPKMVKLAEKRGVTLQWVTD